MADHRVMKRKSQNFKQKQTSKRISLDDTDCPRKRRKQTKSNLKSKTSLPSAFSNMPSSTDFLSTSASSSYHLPISSSIPCNNGNNARLIELLEYTASLAHDVAQIRIDVSRICNNLNLNSSEDIEDVEDLPIKSDSELLKLDKRLHDTEEFSKLVRFFGRHGGRDVDYCTRRILSMLMTNETALAFNWVGGYGKKSFRNLKKIIQMITVSVQQCGNLKLTKISDVENVIKKWLRTAIDRDGGRSKRSKAKQVTSQEE